MDRLAQFHAHIEELWSVGQASDLRRYWRSPTRRWAHSDFGERDNVR